MRRVNFLKRSVRSAYGSVASLTAVLLMIAGNAFADGKAGVTAATTEVQGYFDVGTKLMLVIGAIVGIVGAIKVYQKWNAGEQDTQKVASAWFGSCIFLVVVTAVLRAFFLT